MPNKAIFREYIGVKPYPNTLHGFPVDIINPYISEFHFILGFATEDYVLGKGTGNFRRNWNVHYFSPEKVNELKEMYPKVKVVISIGGRDPKYPFIPAGGEATWVANAISSLQGIIEAYDYNIDGIDIHYEHIDSSINDFARYMGQVIVGLRNQAQDGLKKQAPAIKVVSIAPSARVAPYYRGLYRDYNADIDWVDYQFYSHNVSSNDEFASLYLQQSEDFDGSKLLVGGSTDPADAANMSPEVFIKGVMNLIERNDSILRGAFVWNANNSAVPTRANEKPFFLEETIQALLPAEPPQ